MDKCVIQCIVSISFKGKKFQTQGDLGTPESNFTSNGVPRFPGGLEPPSQG